MPASHRWNAWLRFPRDTLPPFASAANVHRSRLKSLKGFAGGLKITKFPRKHLDRRIGSTNHPVAVCHADMDTQAVGGDASEGGGGAETCESVECVLNGDRGPEHDAGVSARRLRSDS